MAARNDELKELIEAQTDILKQLRPPRTDIWKQVALILMAVVVSIGGSWITWGKEQVDRIEVKEMIQELSPYTREKDALQQNLKYLSELITKFDSRVTRLEEADIDKERRLLQLEDSARSIRKVPRQ